MSIKTYRSLKDDELRSKLVELNDSYIDKKFGIMNNSSKDTSVLKKIRRDTARIKTILNERNNNE
jgi:ribosomal protein L29